MEQLDLRELMRIARRRAWIVILLMLVAGSAAYYRSSQETPVYSASATLIVNPGVSSVGNDYQATLQSQQAAITFVQMVGTDPVLTRVRTVLGIVDLNASVSASVVGESEFLTITATSVDRNQAVAVVNATAAEFTGYVTDRARSKSDIAKSALDEQIVALETQRADIDTEIETLRTGPDASSDSVATQIEDLRAQRAEITQQLNALNTEAATLEGRILASQPSVEVVSEATAAGQISPNPRNSAMLGLFVGLMLGVAVVALLEFLDNTVKPELDLQGMTGAPVLATVTALTKLAPGGSQVFTLTRPTSSATESLRLLRTNLEFASATEDVKALTVSSPGPGEGKSTIAANIGVVMAQSGKSVVVIDADLRKPTQHRIFGVPSDRGLTTLLTHPELGWDSVAVKVALPGLQLIPAGPIPPNPADLVGSRRFEQLISQVKSDVDIVIIDSPPVLAASDSLAISRYTDGVIMVCRSHFTRLDAVRHCAQSVHQGGIRLIGLVVNRQKGQKGAFYYGEYYGTAAPAEPHKEQV